MSDIPKGIIRISGTVSKQYALLLLLDGLPYVDLTARKQSEFVHELNAWKRNTYPSLARSQVRFFKCDPDGVITELLFSR